MTNLNEYIPFLIPLIILQLLLALIALIKVVKQPSFRYGNRLLWGIVVLFISIFGPIIYFMIGKEEKNE